MQTRGGAGLAASGWLLATLASVAAVWGWTRALPSRPETALDSPRSAARPRPDAATREGDHETSLRPQIAALRACVANLDRCEQARESTRTPPSEATARTLACLADPGVQAHVRRAVETECASAGDGSRAAREAEESARDEAAASFLTRELGITPEEQSELGQYLCAIRDARGLLADTGRESEEADAAHATYEHAREIRELTLADVESILGAERYARLRAVGGLGLLVDAAQCEEPSTTAAP
jgi:hypothetical protein